MNDARADAGRLRESRFRPARGLRNAHLQTLVGGIAPTPRPPGTMRERWELPDRDFCDLDWLGCDTSRPWALVLPGIAGSLASPYALRLLKRLAAAGYRAGLLNYRGLSGPPNRLATAYHAGFTQDLDLVVHRLASRHGPGIVTGFSLGGSLVLKWLGESGAGAPVRAAAAVSVPFRLGPASNRLGAGKLRIYDRHLTALMKRFARRKFARRPAPIALPPWNTVRSLHAFDDAVTAPLHGFRDAADYYEKTSCLPWLRRIGVPTLVLNARDDPMVPRSSLPAADALSPQVTLELSAHGGHIGFIGRGRLGLPRFTLSDRLLLFFDEPNTVNAA